MLSFVAQVELREDLVGSCVVGDVITVLGLVKVLATGDAKPAGRHCGQLNNDRLCRALHWLRDGPVGDGGMTEVWVDAGCRWPAALFV